MSLSKVYDINFIILQNLSDQVLFRVANKETLVEYLKIDYFWIKRLNNRFGVTINVDENLNNPNPPNIDNSINNNFIVSIKDYSNSILRFQNKNTILTNYKLIYETFLHNQNVGKIAIKYSLLPIIQIAIDNRYLLSEFLSNDNRTYEETLHEPLYNGNVESTKNRIILSSNLNVYILLNKNNIIIPENNFIYLVRINSNFDLLLSLFKNGIYCKLSKTFVLILVEAILKRVNNDFFKEMKKISQFREIMKRYVLLYTHLYTNCSTIFETVIPTFEITKYSFLGTNLNMIAMDSLKYDNNIKSLIYMIKNKIITDFSFPLILIDNTDRDTNINISNLNESLPLMMLFNGQNYLLGSQFAFDNSNNIISYIEYIYKNNHINEETLFHIFIYLLKEKSIRFFNEKNMQDNVSKFINIGLNIHYMNDFIIRYITLHPSRNGLYNMGVYQFKIIFSLIEDKNRWPKIILTNVIISSYFNLVSFIIKSINMTTNDLNKPLQVAIEQNNKIIIKELLKNGANVNVLVKYCENHNKKADISLKLIIEMYNDGVLFKEKEKSSKKVNEVDRCMYRDPETNSRCKTRKYSKDFCHNHRYTYLKNNLKK